MTVAPKPVRELVEQWQVFGRTSQAGILWPRDQWLAKFPDQVSLIQSLPERIDRDVVREACMDATVGPAEAERAFVVTMVWGYGRVGYGTWRTRRVLTRTRTAPALLAEVAGCLAEDGSVAAYRLLGGHDRIWGLGPAFGTRYLSFCPQGACRPACPDPRSGGRPMAAGEFRRGVCRRAGNRRYTPGTSNCSLPGPRTSALPKR